MRRHITAFLLILTLLTGSLCSAQAGALSREEVYRVLQQELRSFLEGGDSMPMEELAARFDELGNYRKSAFFSYYVSVLRDAELGVFDNLPLYMELIRLDEDFCALLEELELPTADELEAYARGCQAEQADDWPAAIAYYQQSIAVLDSVRRLAGLRLAGPTATPTPAPTRVPTATPRPTPKPTPRPTATPTMPPRVMKSCTVIAESARARSGAGTEYALVGYVYRGERYDVLDERTASNGRVWYLVNVDGARGWISSGVTEISSMSSNGGSNGNTGYGGTKGYPVGEFCRIIAEEARARSGAGTEYPVVEYVRENQRYEIRDTATASNGKQWYAIVVDGTLCWISSGVAELQ